MNSTFKVALAAAGVIAVVVVGLNVLAQGGGGSGGTSAVPSSRVVTATPPLAASPTVSPSLAVSPSKVPSPSPGAVRITVAGTELGSQIQLTAHVPDAWTLESFGAYRGSSEPPAGVGLFVSLLDNTFKDPCLHIERSPKVGPTVADAAAALGQIPHTSATAPVQMTFAGHTATYLEPRSRHRCPPPNQFSCGGSRWVGGGAWARVGILEVQGQRVVLASRSWPGTSGAAKAERQAILDSIVFQAAS